MERNAPSYNVKGGLGSYPQHNLYSRLARPNSLPVFASNPRLEHGSPLHSPYYHQGHYEGLPRGKEDRQAKYMIGDPLLVSPRHVGHHVSPRFCSPQFAEEPSYDKYPATPPSPPEPINYTDSKLSQYSPAPLHYSPMFPFDSPFYESRGSFPTFRRDSPQSVKYSPVPNHGRTPRPIGTESCQSPMKLSPGYFDSKEVRPLESPDRLRAIEEMRCRSHVMGNQCDVILDRHSNGLPAHSMNDPPLGPSTKEQIHREFAHRFLLENARATEKSRFLLPFSKDYESLRLQLVPRVGPPAQPSHSGGAIRRSVICRSLSIEKGMAKEEACPTEQEMNNAGNGHFESQKACGVENYHPSHNLFEKVFNVGNKTASEKKSAPFSVIDYGKKHVSNDRDNPGRSGSEPSLNRLKTTRPVQIANEVGPRRDGYSHADNDAGSSKLNVTKLAPGISDGDGCRSRKKNTSTVISEKAEFDTSNSRDVHKAHKLSEIRELSVHSVETCSTVKIATSNGLSNEAGGKQQVYDNVDETELHKNSDRRTKAVLGRKLENEPEEGGNIGNNDKKRAEVMFDSEKYANKQQDEKEAGMKTSEYEASDEDETETDESAEERSGEVVESVTSSKDIVSSEETGNDDITNKRTLSREERAILYAMQKFKEMEEKKTNKKRKGRLQDPPEKKGKFAEGKETLLKEQKTAAKETYANDNAKKMNSKQRKATGDGNVLSDETNAKEKKGRHPNSPIVKSAHVLANNRHERMKEHLWRGDKTKKLKLARVKKPQIIEDVQKEDEAMTRDKHKEQELHRLATPTIDKDAAHARSEMHQKSYLLVPSYKGFKDFAPVLLEGRTRQRSSHTDAEKVGRPKFPILVVETVGEKRNEILVKEDEDLDKKIAKESLLAEKIFEDVTYEEGKFKTHVKHLSCNRMTGETVLHKAARLGYDDVVDIKIKEGADVNARDNAGWTALHEACVRGKTDVVKVLLRYGADPNCRSENGIRPLHDAVESGNMDIIRMLLRYGADVAEETYSGLKVPQLARTPQVRGFLRGHIADVQATELFEPDEDPSEENWEFRGSASFLDKETDDAGEILGEFPADSEMQIEFIASSKEPLPVYNLPVFRDDTTIVGYRNYYILNDVLDALSVSRVKFLKKHKVELRTVTWTEFADHIGQSQTAVLPSPPSSGSEEEEPVVTLVHFGNFTARKLFDTKIYQV